MEHCANKLKNAREIESMSFTSLIIVAVALGLYAAFWSWYVGFGRKISPAEIERVMDCLTGGTWTSKQRDSARQFFENDDGKDFVMVNALHFRPPIKKSQALFAKYGAAFRPELVKRAGHPVLMAQAAAANLENLNSDAADDWSMAAMVRYRSRRDFAEIAILFAGGSDHQLKLDAMEKTFAFPAAPWFVLGGPRLVVGLAIALAAALAHVALV
ncbi:MAG: hypothetical protein ACI8W3_002060 [Myxococcota bacterium]